MKKALVEEGGWNESAAEKLKGESLRAAYKQLLTENAGPKSLEAIAQSPLAKRKKGEGKDGEENTVPTRSELSVEGGEDEEEMANEEDAKGSEEKPKGTTLGGNKIEVGYGKKKEKVDCKNLKVQLGKVLGRQPTEEEVLVCLKLSTTDLSRIGEEQGETMNGLLVESGYNDAAADEVRAMLLEGKTVSSAAVVVVTLAALNCSFGSVGASHPNAIGIQSIKGVKERIRTLNYVWKQDKVRFKEAQEYPLEEPTPEQRSPGGAEEARNFLDTFAANCGASLFSRGMERDATEAYRKEGGEAMSSADRRSVYRAVAGSSSVLGQTLRQTMTCQIQEKLPEANRDAIGQIAGLKVKVNEFDKVLCLATGRSDEDGPPGLLAVMGGLTVLEQVDVVTKLGCFTGLREDVTAVMQRVGKQGERAVADLGGRLYDIFAKEVGRRQQYAYREIMLGEAPPGRGQLMSDALEELVLYRCVKRARGGTSPIAVMTAGSGWGGSNGQAGTAKAAPGHVKMPPHCKEFLEGKCNKAAGKCDKPHVSKK